MSDEPKKTDGQHNVRFFQALNALPETLRPLLSAFESQIKAIAVAAFTRGFDAGHQAAKESVREQLVSLELRVTKHEDIGDLYEDVRETIARILNANDG